MVARSAPTLRFSSVRHRDPPPPAPSVDPGKIPSFAHDTTTTVTTRRNAVIQQPQPQRQRQRQQHKHHQLQNKLTPLKQSKLPFPPASFPRLAPGSGGPPPPPRQPQQPTKTIPAPERPFKKAKLDGRHHDQASITGPAKLPLRSRDSQGGLLTTPDPSSTATTAITATITSAASRTRSATATAATTAGGGGGSGGHTTAINNNNNSALAAPPRSPASAISRTTRKSAHSHHHTPVAVSEDVEGGEKKKKKKQLVNGIMIADDDDNDNNDKYKNDRIVNNLLKDGGGGGGASPSTAVVGREKRSLRSNDGGSRSKSELAMYFQNYEQILSLKPVKPEFLSADTAVLLVDDLTQPILLDPAPTSAPAAKLRGKHDKVNLPNGQMAQSLMDNPLLELHDAQILDLRLSTHNSKKPSKDPLDDDVYFKAHRRIERQEKQLRNIERERAQHEKVQLDRLLDELQGHDWLRVMGINGITETEKKLYEPKRAYFIKEVSALIDKFRAWKEEERRRKIERDQCLADEDDDDEEEEDGEDDNEENETEDEDEDEDEAKEAADQFSIGKEDTSTQPNGNGNLESFSPNFQTYGEPPDINDVDAWAARQLHQEAISASSNTAHHNNLLPEHVSIPPPLPSSSSSSSSPPSSSSSSSSSPTSTSTSYPAPAGRDSDRAARAPSPATTHTSAPGPTPPPQQPPQQPPAQPEPQPFTSFYTKRHLRDAAVGKIRRGRTRTAFGQPLPEVASREFRLPPDILTEEAIDACQRKKRRLRRARKG